jgi:hypothetical protein
MDYRSFPESTAIQKLTRRPARPPHAIASSSKTSESFVTAVNGTVGAVFGYHLKEASCFNDF